MDETTEPLRNGDKLPDHPDSTTSRKIISYGAVRDDGDGTVLDGGLHQNEIAILMSGTSHVLGHLYRYAIRNGKIYHTRNLVVVDCKTTDVVDLASSETLDRDADPSDR